LWPKQNFFGNLTGHNVPLESGVSHEQGHKRLTSHNSGTAKKRHKWKQRVRINN